MVELSALILSCGLALAGAGWGVMHLVIARNIWRGEAVPEEVEEKQEPRREWE